MTFNGYKEVIEENDIVMLYISFNKTHVIEVTPTKTTSKGEVVENVFQTSYGALKVKDLIGTRFGSKVQMTKGYGYALHPTPELWTKNLPHRTQIIYATDISLILLQLDLVSFIYTECGNCGNLLSTVWKLRKFSLTHFLCKYFVKVTDLLNKLLKS